MFEFKRAKVLNEGLHVEIHEFFFFLPWYQNCCRELWKFPGIGIATTLMDSILMFRWLMLEHLVGMNGLTVTEGKSQRRSTKKVMKTMVISAGA